ncbi:MAG: hypothetical protein ACYTKD_31610 [Planctomycetota bacterium]|jgi:hypothetical protein
MPQVAAIASAGGNVLQGITARAQAEADAVTLSQQAIRTQEIGRQQEDEFRRDVSAAKASNIAAGGASGLRPNEDANANFAAEAEFQALKIRNNTDVQVAALHTQAENTRDQGRLALIASGINAGASLLRGTRRQPKLDTPAPPTATNKLQFDVNRTNGRIFNRSIGRRS